MKKLILTNWLAKAVSLLLAMTVWFLIKKNIETPSVRFRTQYLKQPEAPVIR
jgi:hypothetical protein